MKHLVIFADGASLGNPGPGGLGVSIQNPDGVEVDALAIPAGHVTNNIAEYRALIEGLKRVIVLGAMRVDAFMDSQLVVEQVAGRYKVRQPHLVPLCAEARALLAKIPHRTLRHIRREKNMRADALSKQGAALNRQK